MNKVELTQAKFHDIVMSPMRVPVTEALRLQLTQGFVIVITESVAPFKEVDRITTKQQFDTVFGAPDDM